MWSPEAGADAVKPTRPAKTGRGPGGYSGATLTSSAADLTPVISPSELQALTGTDHQGRAHGERLRRELLLIPARLISHGGTLTLRLPPGPQILPEVLARLRALPAAA